MESSSCTEAFPGWEPGSYHGYDGVYRRRSDGLGVRVLRHRPATPCPAELGDDWPADRAWLVTFWRRQASESFHVVGPDAAALHDVLSLESVSVATMLVELNSRGGLHAWSASSPGFEWTGTLEDGAEAPQRAGPDWPAAFVAHGWTRRAGPGGEVVERRLGSTLVRLGVDAGDGREDFTPPVWFLEITRLPAQPLRRVLGGRPPGEPAGELYFSPWRDTGLVLDHLAGLHAAPEADALWAWLRTTTDAAVEYVAPGAAR